MDTADIRLDRRSMLLGIGGLVLDVAAVSAMPGRAERPASASASSDIVYSPKGLERNLPAGAAARPRAKLDVAAPFDLDDKVGRTFARLKALENLEGETSYLVAMTRHLLCPPGVPPFPYVNEIDVVTMFLTQPDRAVVPDADEYTVIQNSLFTRVPVDPVTFRPVRRVENPVLGRSIDVPDTLFAASGPMRLGRDAPPNLILQPDRPHYRFGPDLRFILLDIRAGNGSHQPRVDTQTLSVKHDELMDPRKPLIEARSDYTALMRASVFPWTGFTGDDPTQILSMRSAIKVNAVDDIPEPARAILLSRYPDRVRV